MKTLLDGNYCDSLTPFKNYTVRNKDVDMGKKFLNVLHDIVNGIRKVFFQDIYKYGEYITVIKCKQKTTI